MMRLSTMWKVDGTIDADGSSPVARRILERWSHDRGSARFFRSSANFVYVFRAGDKHHFLRFADGSERGREAVEAQVELLGWLAAAGIDVAVPVPSRGGNLVETVEADRGTFHAAVFPALEGEQLETGDLDGSGFRRWGAALGGLHSAMGQYSGPRTFAPPTWRDHLELAGEYLPEDAPVLRDELGRITSSLAALPTSSDAYGLIHSDFELDNLVWRDGSIGILDFDDCSRLWYAADIAFALRDLPEWDGGRGDRRLRAFVEGYSEHYPIDEGWLSHVPLFTALDNLLRYTRIVRATDLAVGPEHPGWLAALSRKLRDLMAEYEAAIESNET